MKDKSGVGVEIERKYIIEKPDFERLGEAAGYTVSDIVQIYLPAEKGQTHRIRSRAYKDKTVYIETRKIRIDKMSVTEIEREIEEEEFLRLSENIAEGTRPVVKRRHTLDLGVTVAEIDEYPEWSSTCIMETELPSRDTEVSFPPYIRIIREVTGERAYSNASMSKCFPKEEGTV